MIILWESILSFYYVGPGDPTQIIRLDNECLPPESSHWLIVAIYLFTHFFIFTCALSRTLAWPPQDREGSGTAQNPSCPNYLTFQF